MDHLADSQHRCNFTTRRHIYTRLVDLHADRYRVAPTLEGVTIQSCAATGRHWHIDLRALHSPRTTNRHINGIALCARGFTTTIYSHIKHNHYHSVQLTRNMHTILLFNTPIKSLGLYWQQPTLAPCAIFPHSPKRYQPIHLR